MNISDNDIVVNSWSELCDRLYDNSWKVSLGRFRTDYAFRGLSDKDYDLSTSYLRNSGKDSSLEYHLLRNFKKYSELDHPGSMSDWRLMTIAQHHGLPTRLLDWTYSPFVAAHFATDDISKYDRDSAIWNVDFVKVHKLLPDPLKNVLELTGSNTFTIDMLEEALKGLKEFDALDPGNLLVFFEPPSVNSRIVNQFAFFSVMSSATAGMDDWLAKHPDLFRRIIIPKELKLEVRDKLDQANITERILFPGLDGLANWLKRHYQPIPLYKK
jgi:hypothetical protein